MGDIIKSREYQGVELMHEFQSLVATCNEELASCLLSPYTITLGDEFQGVARSLLCSVRSLFYLEEMVLREHLPFRLRYVVHYGEIDTPLNPNIAYGMVGPGLAHARELLTNAGKRRPRFRFDLSNHSLAFKLNGLFQVTASLTEEWRPKDWQLILDMLSMDRAADIGAKYNMNRSQVSKREKTLRVEEYKTLKAVIIDLCQEKRDEVFMD